MTFKKIITLIVLVISVLLSISSCATAADITPPVSKTQTFTGVSQFQVKIEGTSTFMVDCEDCTANIISENSCQTDDNYKTVVIKDNDSPKRDCLYNFSKGAGIYTISVVRKGRDGEYRWVDTKFSVIMKKGGTVTKLSP